MSETEEITPGEVKLCEACGTRPARKGSRFCQFPACVEERTQKRDEQQARNEPTPPKTPPKSAPKPRATAAGLEREIKDALMGTAAVLAITNQGIYVGVEATVDEFAAAWANVARQSPSAERYIRALLAGGVWITAASATLVMAVAVMAASGVLPSPLVPMGWYVVGRHPELLTFIQAQQAKAQPAPEPEPEQEQAA